MAETSTQIPKAGDEPKLPFSPGPWVVNDDEPDNLKVECAFYDDETPGVCGSHSPQWPLTADDARAIAALPDLVEAAQTVLDGLNERIAAAQRDNVPVFAGIAALQDALNKINGVT